MPIARCFSTNRRLTSRSLAEVFTPSGLMGLSETSSSAPLGMWLAKPTTNKVAVSMSMPIARVVRR